MCIMSVGMKAVRAAAVLMHPHIHKLYRLELTNELCSYNNNITPVLLCD
jgi:hypothetical protein